MRPNALTTIQNTFIMRKQLRREERRLPLSLIAVRFSRTKLSGLIISIFYTPKDFGIERVPKMNPIHSLVSCNFPYRFLSRTNLTRMSHLFFFCAISTLASADSIEHLKDTSASSIQKDP